MSSGEESDRSSSAAVDLEPVEVAMSPVERFEEYLQSRGLRNTDQRRFLIERVFEQHQHFDADQLIERLPRKGTENYVSRPTVYRALKEFVDAGLLRSFELNGRSVYELDYGYPAHDHLYCIRCNQLIEFQSEELAAIRDAVARQHRFRVQSHRLTIEGICEDCSRAASRNRRRQNRV